MEYNIVREVGVISVSRIDGSRWRKELNIISWNGKPPKFDVREWNNDRTVCRRGITLTRDELRTMFKLLQDAEKEEAI